MQLEPDEWRLCACGAHVGVWRSKGRLSLNHTLPLCAAYDQVSDAHRFEAYLAEHTTTRVELPAAADDPTS